MLKSRLQSLWQAGLKTSATCPRCKAGKPRITGDTFTCDSCGFIGAPSEWSTRTNRDATPTGLPGAQPANSKITRRELPSGGLAFEVPPSKNSGGLVFFSAFWLTIVSIITASLLSPIITGDWKSIDSDIPVHLRPYLIPLFILPFWAIGLGLLYWALRLRNSKHLLLLENNTLVHVREFLNRKKTTSLLYPNIQSITTSVFYTRNYHPVYGLEIRGSGKKIRFGSSLSDKEKGWLVAELNAAVFPEPEPESHHPAGMQLDMPATTTASRNRFELILPPNPNAKTSWPGLLIGLLIVGSFISIGLSPLMADAGFFRYLWLGFCTLFLLIMIGGLISNARSAKQQLKILSDGARLSLITEHAGRELERQSFDLADIRRIAHYPSGSSNNEPRYAASLITPGKVVPLFRFRGDTPATRFIHDLRSKLNLPD